MPRQQKIRPRDLLIHILNVGFGDTNVIEFPADKTGKRRYGVVDCNNGTKTKKYLKKLTGSSKCKLKFVCATHPHKDHIQGLNSILGDKNFEIEEFWDSGFRQYSKMYLRILKTLLKRRIKMVRVTAGMEWFAGKVRITALSPSISLRNRYATHGIDMNNASIVLRLEHHKGESLMMVSQEYEGSKSKEAVRKAGRSVVILAGDAEFDAWARISQDFATRERTLKKKYHQPLIKKMVNYLACSVVKVSHHGSMHSAPLDIYERLSPDLAVISTEQEIKTKKTGVQLPLTRGLFPHQSALIALEESGALVVTTDGSYITPVKKYKNRNFDKCGSIVVVVPPGGTPKWTRLGDISKDVPDPPRNLKNFVSL